jgi:hypothetical protein
MNSTVANLNYAAARAANTPLQGRAAVSQNLPAIDRLMQQMHDPNVDASLSSSEGHNNADAYKLVRDTIPQIGLSAASAAHCISGLSRLLPFLPKSLGELLDRHAQKFSKGVNILNYVVTAADAFIHKRSVDGLARAAYPAVIPFVKLEDMYMASGFSSGTTMMERALQEKTETMTGNKDFVTNITNNLRAFVEMWMDISRDGLTGLVDKIRNVKKNPNPLMFLGGNCNFLGALLGVLFGKSSDLVRKLATLIRNTGSMSTDVAKLFCGESNFLIAGVAYVVVSALDVIKDYAGETTKRTLSHFSVAVNNFANYYYLKASKVRSNLAVAS